MPAYCERTNALVQIENSTLRSIYELDGAEACKKATRTLLISTATMYSFVASPQALNELFETIQSTQDSGLLS